MTVSTRISTNKYFVPYKDCVNELLREKTDAETQHNAWDHEWQPGDQIIHPTENIVCARDDINKIINDKASWRRARFLTRFLTDRCLSDYRSAFRGVCVGLESENR